MLTQQQLIGILIILWGAYLLAAGILGWRSAQRGRFIRGLVRLVGPIGTRIVFAIGGAALIAGGLLYMAAGAS